MGMNGTDAVKQCIILIEQCASETCREMTNIQDVCMKHLFGDKALSAYEVEAFLIRSVMNICSTLKRECFFQQKNYLNRYGWPRVHNIFGESRRFHHDSFVIPINIDQMKKFKIV